MTDRPLTFFDAETTSLDEPRLIEGAIGMLDGKVREFRAKNPVPIDMESESIHGISADSIAHLPFFKDRDDYEEIKLALENGIVVAHNAPFDVGVLANEGIRVTESIDTERVSRHLWPDLARHNLQYLRVALHVSISQDERVAHSAAGDVRVLMAVFQKMLAAVEQDLSKLVELSSRPALILKLTFGKHAGKSFREVNRIDREYIEYLYRQKMVDRGEDFIHTVEYWMNIRSA